MIAAMAGAGLAPQRSAQPSSASVRTVARIRQSCGRRRHMWATRSTVVASAEARSPWKHVWESNSDDWNSPFHGNASEGFSRVIVALGKFDAMHKGHRALALSAAEMGGQPWLLSFSGMGEVLGWPERLPLVAACDRPRVLESWGPLCAQAGPVTDLPKGPAPEVVPQQRYIPFSEIRGLGPAEFVKLLSDSMKVSGVVAGQNYRFGYRAAGDAALLVKLGEERGMQVSILELLGVGEPNVVETVSSSAIRDALAEGGATRMSQVESWLGRCYRSVAESNGDIQMDNTSVRVPASAFLNQLPTPGTYICRVGISKYVNRYVSTKMDELTGQWRDNLPVVISEQGAVIPVDGKWRAGIASAVPKMLELPDAVRVIIDFTET